jgi:ABC-type multidrug transport system fused ATPase/permease subunit
VALARVRGAIRFEDVSFAYDEARPILHNISLEVEPGKTLALVGPTGAGKTTLAGLIPRFFDPTHGRVLIDGQDVRDMQLASLRAQVSLVPQEAFLFPFTVAENIAYGRPTASLHEIETAARGANAHDFICRLPNGYDTVLGERGATLSGGERQRIAIARALLKDSGILILDEPTSAVDSETEEAVIAALRNLVRGRTTLIIAHRLTTVRHADRIVVMQDGRIVESGSYETVILQGQRYAQYVQAPLQRILS